MRRCGEDGEQAWQNPPDSAPSPRPGEPARRPGRVRVCRRAGARDAADRDRAAWAIQIALPNTAAGHDDRPRRRRPTARRRRRRVFVPGRRLGGLRAVDDRERDDGDHAKNAGAQVARASSPALSLFARRDHGRRRHGREPRRARARPAPAATPTVARVTNLLIAGTAGAAGDKLPSRDWGLLTSGRRRSTAATAAGVHGYRGFVTELDAAPHRRSRRAAGRHADPDRVRGGGRPDGPAVAPSRRPRPAIPAADGPPRPGRP